MSTAEAVKKGGVRGSSGSMFRHIFASMTLFVLVVIVLVAVIFTAIFFTHYEKNAEDDLVNQAEDVAAYAERVGAEEALSTLSGITDSLRFTLVATDGTVLFDSEADVSTMGNHASRSEIVQATQEGTAISQRVSATLGTDTLYAAVLLSDGSVVRLAETRPSLAAFMGDMATPLVIVLLVAIALCALVSYWLARHIMKPINALDFTDPLDNEIYDEMVPFLQRIDEQQRLLKEQNAELDSAQTMRRDFSSNVSHEMKTPLQVISGYAELMKDGMVAPEDNQRFASLIYDEAQNMRTLIDQVLTLSRLDDSALDDRADTVDLLAIATECADRVQPIAEEANVSVSVSGESVIMRGHRALLEEMIRNLIENGVRYNHSGGKVEVTVESDTEHNEAVLYVSDTGVGIAPEYREKVFERFFRIDKSRSKETGGTGLGLAIVKHAALYHGGTVEILDSPNGGTTFEVRLPRGMAAN